MSDFWLNSPTTAKRRAATVLLPAVTLLIALAGAFAQRAPTGAQGMAPIAPITPNGTSTPTSTPVLTVTTAPTDGVGGEAQGGGLFSEVEGDPPPSSDVDTLASRLVDIDFGQLASVTNPSAGPKGPSVGEPPTPQTLVLNLFENVVFTGIVEYVEPTSSGHALWGSLDGVEMGTMILSQKVCAGRIRTNVPTPGYNIQPLFRILPQHTVALRCAKSLELPQNGFLRGNQP